MRRDSRRYTLLSCRFLQVQSLTYRDFATNRHCANSAGSLILCDYFYGLGRPPQGAVGRKALLSAFRWPLATPKLFGDALKLAYSATLCTLFRNPISMAVFFFSFSSSLSLLQERLRGLSEIPYEPRY